MIFRMIRAFALRQAVGMGARIKRVTSVSRYAVKVLPKAVSTVVSAGKKPTSREDYFETKRMYIAKSLVMAAALAAIALFLLAFFVLRPWLISRYFTAHFFRENSAVETHSGKVALYYDEEKSRLFFKGRLTEGVIGGEGEEYDENGRVIYSGQWENGVYSGGGSLYSGGELIYEGGFSGGVYAGQGALYKNGALAYRGEFVGGAPNGEGISFGLDGEVVYRGGFAGGLYSAEGREYMAGQMVFRGEFADGLRNGPGTVFLEEGVTLEAFFEGGEIRGAAKIYSEGFLVYEGAVSGGRPQGFGALYSPQSGRELYRGELVNGRPSGADMLGVGVADLAPLFGGAPPDSSVGDGYFIYENAAAGFALFYPRRQSENEPQCAMVMLYEPADTGIPWRDPPWQNAAEYEASERDAPPRAGGYEAPPYLYNIGYGAYHRAEYTLEDGGVLLTLWSREPGGDAVTVTWEHVGALNAPPEGDQSDGHIPEDGKLDARVENMLAELGLLPASPGAAAGEEEALSNPYYGDTSPESLLMQLTSGALHEKLELLADYYLNAELRLSNERRAEILHGRMERLTNSAAPSESVLKTVETRIKSVALDISACAVEMNRAEERFGAKLEAYDVQSALLVLDPSKIDAEALRDAVLAGGAAGFADVKEYLLDAELAYQRLMLAQTELSMETEALAAANDSFAVGRLGMAEVEDAQLAVQEKTAALYGAMRALSRELTEADAASGWMLSAERGRFAEAISSVLPEAEPPPLPPLLTEPSAEPGTAENGGETAAAG
jgi:hypothetical protein